MIIVCQSQGSRPILVLELFTLMPRLFGTTSRCLSVLPVQLLPSRNIWRHISLIWPFPPRYRHYPWPADVTELFPWFCCWTLIRLSRHWACLRWGYWRYRSLILIDWLIDWIAMLSCVHFNCGLVLCTCTGSNIITYWYGLIECMCARVMYCLNGCIIGQGNVP